VKKGRTDHGEPPRSPWLPSKRARVEPPSQKGLSMQHQDPSRAQRVGLPVVPARGRRRRTCNSEEGNWRGATTADCDARCGIEKVGDVCYDRTPLPPCKTPLAGRVSCLRGGRESAPRSPTKPALTAVQASAAAAGLDSYATFVNAEKR